MKPVIADIGQSGDAESAVVDELDRRSEFLLQYATERWQRSTDRLVGLDGKLDSVMKFLASFVVAALGLIKVSAIPLGVQNRGTGLPSSSGAPPQEPFLIHFFEELIRRFGVSADVSVDMLLSVSLMFAVASLICALIGRAAASIGTPTGTDDLLKFSLSDFRKDIRVAKRSKLVQAKLLLAISYHNTEVGIERALHRRAKMLTFANFGAVLSLLFAALALYSSI